MPERSIKDREKVLCLHAGDVEALFRPHSKPWLSLSDNNPVNIALATGSTAFLPRWVAEDYTNWRHFCTYSVLRNRERVFTYRRGSSGGEDRLHGKLSLGVGGHVGLGDYDNHVGITAYMIDEAAVREIDEELYTGPKWDFGMVGLIADDSSPVNRVHLGVVYTVSVHANRVQPREDCLADPAWLTTAELRERCGEFESWSQIVIRQLIGGAA